VSLDAYWYHNHPAALLKGQGSTAATAHKKNEKYFSCPGKASKQVVYVETCEMLKYLC